MTDIVERLRAFAPTVAARSRVPLAAAAIINAADEIERLREALREIALLDGANIPNGAAFSIAIDIAQSALGEGKE